MTPSLVEAAKDVTQTWDHENNWRKDNSGGAYRQALQTKTGKPRFRDLQKRLDGRLLQTLQGVYEACYSAKEETRKGVGEPNRATHQGVAYKDAARLIDCAEG